MGGATNIPPGFHFFPSDEDLVVHFLRRKLLILQGTALQAGNQWYFFSHAAQSRTSPNGYWNPIGADETVTSNGCIVGLKKTLIFCTGEPSKGFKTNWIMHEYHLQDEGYNVSGSSTSSSSSSSRKSQRKRVHSSTVSDIAYPVASQQSAAYTHVTTKWCTKPINNLCRSPTTG
ncbi:hypothetical protein BAE44_0014200 [Dichanthelium oligosanthes]|uniref:NAC domain-containing protein n=1 Tax=Dichanthelium oligosanthes TaxID=888268 RepID=A0A1E5VI72_9POAL|nr:hypothetical protein BAE44_0014200 [Dichanthelium oligosanthes]